MEYWWLPWRCLRAAINKTIKFRAISSFSDILCLILCLRRIRVRMARLSIDRYYSLELKTQLRLERVKTNGHFLTPICRISHLITSLNLLNSLDDQIKQQQKYHFFLNLMCFSNWLLSLPRELSTLEWIIIGWSHGMLPTLSINSGGRISRLIVKSIYRAFLYFHRISTVTRRLLAFFLLSIFWTEYPDSVACCRPHG